MRVELLYFDGCANWTVADERLAEVLRTVGRTDVTVNRRKVETAVEAEAVEFTGSPTPMSATRSRPVRSRSAWLAGCTRHRTGWVARRPSTSL